MTGRPGGGGELACSNSCTLDISNRCELPGGTCLITADCRDPCQPDLCKLQFTCQSPRRAPRSP